jgi:hypothetical protein
MSGAIPPLPNMPSRRGTQLKHRDNFNFAFIIIIIIINGGGGGGGGGSSSSSSSSRSCSIEENYELRMWEEVFVLCLKMFSQNLLGAVVESYRNL